MYICLALSKSLTSKIVTVNILCTLTETHSVGNIRQAFLIAHYDSKKLITITNFTTISKIFTNNTLTITHFSTNHQSHPNLKTIFTFVEIHLIVCDCSSVLKHKVVKGSFICVKALYKLKDIAYGQRSLGSGF